MKRWPLIILVLLVVETSMAQLPRTMSYQGVLTDTAGNPKASGTYAMAFLLYNQSVGGTALWQENRSVQVNKGLFSVLLGEVTPFPDSVRFDHQYWLGIQVGANPEMTPRVKLASVPYSLNGLYADSAGYVKHIPPVSRPVSPPITANEIDDRAVSLSKIDTTGARANQVITFSGGSVVWGMPSSGGLSLPYSGTTNTATAFRVENQDSIDNYNVAVLGISTAPSGSTYGVGGITNSAGGFGSAIGTYGLATNLSGRSIGVYGATYSETDAAVGVKGSALSSTGATEGVRGETNGTGDYAAGVVGFANGSTGVTYGVSGSTSSGTDAAAGVAGYSLSFSGVTNGVYGKTNSLTSGATGVSGFASGASGATNGVYGSTMSSTDGAAGVFGFVPATSGITYGVYGRTQSLSDFAAGVNGYAARTSGISYGVYGATNSTTSGASGVFGSADNVSGSENYGVYGRSTNGIGVAGVTTGGVGIEGLSTNSWGIYGYSIHNTAIRARTEDTSWNAVYGENGGSGAAGALGSNTHGFYYTGSAGVYGYGPPNGFAGFFVGDVFVGGTFTCYSKNFIMDHPVDPANKILMHSCVESNDRMNIYDGTITTDGGGDAIIKMPDYFEALNGEYRYQLTVIGQFAQAIVSSEISGNQFTIKTDKPNVKVSWQVTGVRHDAYAKSHPFQAEKEKIGSARGHYLAPEAFGLPPNPTPSETETEEHDGKENNR